LVCLRADGARTPWFCVHAVSGDVLAYRELSIGSRPIYALQAPEVDAHPGTVEGLAALYIAAIRTVQPHGPYHLGGWSMGGVIAYEMARQLREAGEPVATLALIDSYTPDAVKAGERDGLRPAHDPDAETPLYRANVQAMDRYAPRPFGGSVKLFAAAGLGETTGLLHDLQLGGWKKLAGDGLTTVSVPGDHYSILRQPGAQHLSDALARYIDEATD
jgi:thioesterase domain-containing protein